MINWFSRLAAIPLNLFQFRLRVVCMYNAASSGERFKFELTFYMLELVCFLLPNGAEIIFLG